jgi:methionine-rich copper-binding protein CopC
MTPTSRAGLACILFASCAACDRSDLTNRQAAPVLNAPANETGGQPDSPAGAGNATADSETAGSILAGSVPAAGSTVTGPVDELELHFNPPARLGEVTVTGPEGAMPMMVTAAGEVEHYSLPLSGRGAGRYTVDWRASARGVDYRGSFGFEVR